MSVILYLLGILVVAAGVAAIGFGIPINEFTLGTTLIITGVTGLTGGLILIGLAAVVSELGRVGDALKTRPVARPAARAAEPVEAPAPAAPSMVAVPPPAAVAGPRPSPVPAGQRPRPDVPGREPRAPQPQPAAAPSAVDVSASAIERLRSAIPRGERPKAEPSVVAEGEEVPLSPSEGVPHQPAAPLAPKITAEDRAGGAAVEALKASRLDFLFRSKPAESRASDPRAPDLRAPTPAEPEPEPAPEQAQAQPEPALPEPEERQSEEPHTAAILKSGVVDGMAYTLYADGSIEAKLPHGTVRFGSIAELRAHIETNS
jgi:hypothetical protein